MSWGDIYIICAQPQHFNYISKWEQKGSTVTAENSVQNTKFVKEGNTIKIWLKLRKNELTATQNFKLFIKKCIQTFYWR